MKLLAIDTSGAALSAALTEESQLIASFGVHTGKNHSLALLPMLNALLENCSLTLADIDAFAVTLGPGSFTGLRIGCATALAWRDALQKPVYGISSTEAAAKAAGSGLVCPIFDARRMELYAAFFRAGMRLSEDLALSPEALISRVRDLAEPVTFIGDAWPVYESLLSTELGPLCRSNESGGTLFFAEAAAKLARQKVLASEAPATTLAPVYLRLSEAEEKRLARGEALHA